VVVVIPKSCPKSVKVLNLFASVVTRRVPVGDRADGVAMTRWHAVVTLGDDFTGEAMDDNVAEAAGRAMRQAVEKFIQRSRASTIPDLNRSRPC
jgi:hypothetical protein